MYLHIHIQTNQIEIRKCPIQCYYIVEIFDFANPITRAD